MGPEQDMSGHDMSSHAGHDMSSHVGHDMSSHADLAQPTSHDSLQGHGMHGDTGAAGEGSHYVLMGGHGDGLLQAGTSEVLLFAGAVTSNAGSLALACLVLMLVAIALEYLRLLSWWLESRFVKCSGERRDEGGVIIACNGTKQTSVPSKVCPTSPVWVAILGLLNVFIYVVGTCLMLITMTFNIYIIVAIGVGFSLGKIATMFTKVRIMASAKSA